MKKQSKTQTNRFNKIVFWICLGLLTLANMYGVYQCYSFKTSFEEGKIRLLDRMWKLNREQQIIWQELEWLNEKVANWGTDQL